jgi:hypothetical protein
VGTLSSELAPLADHGSDRPRVYADANVPSGLVNFMRLRLGWDVLFVLEQPDLRRARDTEHFRLARQLRRTLVTLDHDYLDDRAFPAFESPGVIVVTAPDERGLAILLGRLDRTVLRGAEHGAAMAVPLIGRKLHVHPDWTGEVK